MTDPLDDLKRAFEGGTPDPDAERRKATLARTMEKFDRSRESAAESPRTDDRLGALAAFGHEMRNLLAALTSRPAVAVAAGLGAVGLAVLFVFIGRDAAWRQDAVLAEAGVDANGPEWASPGPLTPEPVAAQPGPEAPATESVESRSATVREEARPAAPSAASSRQDGSSVVPEAPQAERDRLAAEFAALPDGADEGEGDGVILADVAPAPVAEAVQSTGRTPESPGRESRGEPRRMEQAMVVLERATGRQAGAAESARLQGAVTVASEPPLVAAFPVSSRSLPDVVVRRPPNTEAFANEDASPVRIASDEPVSTFSIDVDTASYSVVRSSLTNGYLPSPESVRIEEMVNYFPYAYPPPGERGEPFRPTVTVSETPWNPDTLLMHIGIQGRLPEAEGRPPLNLVFLIDTSGSMNRPNKLPLLVQSFRLMLGQLDPADEVAIVAYAGSAGLALGATASSDRGVILAALDGLQAGGSTAGAAGIRLAYRTAGEMAADGEVTRVVLATDGDFNVGISDPDQLEDFIARQRDRGVYLSVLGFGRGNLDDATMQALAQNGNGRAAYIDTLSEARKVLVDQLVGALFPLADDVKIQVEFNPAAVAEYRLIGYETRALRREDFNNDRVDAGEIGAGHSVTAIYEVTPVGSPAVLHDALRYAGRPAEPSAAGESPARRRELAFLRLRYKPPGQDTSELVELPIARDSGEAGADQRFAAAVAGFGQLLRDGAYTGNWTWADAIALAEANTGDDRFGYRREAVTLMRLAESLAEAR